jgi:ribose transport system permease protein
VIIAAGIDLSVGSLIALCAVVTAWFVRSGTPPAAAALLGILAGGVAGLFNGLLITRLRLAPFIVTLGAMLIFRGIALDIADNQSVVPGIGKLGVVQDMLESLRPGHAWLLVPWGVWLVVGLALLTGGVLRYTRFGRHTFAIGSSEDTARLCGVAVDRVKTLVFTLGGLFAGLGGLVLLSRLQTGDPTSAFGAELDVIAAVVIGGGSLAGGQGSIIGSLAGAMLMIVIAAGCQQMDIADYWQKIITGAIIIVAIALDHLRHRRAR